MLYRSMRRSDLLIRQINIFDPSQVASLRTTSSTRSLSLDPLNKYVVSAHFDGNVVIHSIDTMKDVHTIREYIPRVSETCAAAAPS